MIFVPKEKSKEAIDKLLAQYQKEREEELAEKRRKILLEKYGE